MAGPEKQEIVPQTTRTIDLIRGSRGRLEHAPIFGADSPLDSLGPAALLIEGKEPLQDGRQDIVPTVLGTMSKGQRPLRNVPPRVAFIPDLTAEGR